MVHAGCRSGPLWLQVTLGRTLRVQEGRVTSWSQRTEVFKSHLDIKETKILMVCSFEGHGLDWLKFLKFQEINFPPYIISKIN